MADASVLFAAAQALYRAGRASEARERCERLLAEAPGHGGALHLLGLMALRDGETARAVTLLTEAAAADPDVPSLHANLGMALEATGRPAEAEATHERVLALRPGDADALMALAALALARGDGDTALQRALAAWRSRENPATRRLFADIAGSLRLNQDDRALRRMMTRAIAEQWGPATPLVRAATGLVRTRLAAGGRLEDDTLLRAMLAAAPLSDAVLEDALTTARHTLLNGGGDGGFAAALAQQCFLNGYIFWQGEYEGAQVATLKARIETALAAGDALADSDVAALACYLPLHAVSGVEKIAATPSLAPLLKQQRDEPATEKHIAAAFTMLAPVHDDETPWPRWSGSPALETPVPLHAYLAARFPAADLSGVPQKPETLVAGCGTGQYALHLMRALELGEATAIDLSRANLAFTARKADDAGLQLTYAVGDILQSAALGRKFGLIECGGVLHQLPDPLRGWDALLEVLEPGGVMRIAVHSAVAQQKFADLRALIAREGFAPTPEGIRAARHWLKARGDFASVLEAPVFFTDGGCRHLLFAHDEHPLTLAQIAAFIKEHRLTLIGLDVAPAVAAAYRARFPNDPAATDLDNWALFEQDNPDTFTAMIQFWLRW
jgi:SAM-dependent methyltransferase